MSSESLRANVSKFLYPDQLEKPKDPSGSKDVGWSDETIQRSLSIRSVVGSKGYEYLCYIITFLVFTCLVRTMLQYNCWFRGRLMSAVYWEASKRAVGRRPTSRRH